MVVDYRWINFYIPAETQLMSLILASTEVVKHRIELSDVDAPLLADSQGHQRFYNRIHNGFEIIITNFEGEIMTWGDMWNLMFFLRSKCWKYTCIFSYGIAGEWTGEGRIDRV